MNAIGLCELFLALHCQIQTHFILRTNKNHGIQKQINYEVEVKIRVSRHGPERSHGIRSEWVVMGKVESLRGVRREAEVLNEHPRKKSHTR